MGVVATFMLRLFVPHEFDMVHLNVWYKVLEENAAWRKILEFYLTLKSNFELANTYEFKFV